MVLKKSEAASYMISFLHAHRFEEQAYRSCMGILQLAKAHGNNALNAACHKAEEMHSVTYTTIKNILKNGQETTPSVRRKRPIPSHENLRSGSGNSNCKRRIIMMTYQTQR